MQYVMKPVDNLFFRSSSPFEAGGETIAIEGEIPPLPSVYAGAFRPYLKKEPDTPRLRIGLNGLWLGEEPYFPAPRDLYVPKQREEKTVKLKPMELRKKPLSNFPLDYVMCPGQDSQKKEKAHRNLYLKGAELARYLNAEKREYESLDLNQDYLVQERRIGIALDPGSGTSKKEQFYQPSYLRMCRGLRLFAELNQDTDRDSGILKLGGEGKTAHFSKIEKKQEFRLRTGEPETGFFKLYLATPAIFRHGWLPGWIDPKDRTGCFIYKNKGVRVRLMGACVGRSALCGGFGFDKKAGKYRPRELRFAVPAGSVYYFQLLKGTPERVKKLFHQKCISDYRESWGFTYLMYDRSRYCDRGFGYTFVGKWNGEQEEMDHEL